MEENDGIFEWDPKKAAGNLTKHGVSFDEAKEAFRDLNALEEYDERHSATEHRYNLIGRSSQRLLFVVFSESASGLINLISAREAEKTHQQSYEQNISAQNFPEEETDFE
jgi:uncharacterized protein